MNKPLSRRLFGKAMAALPMAAQEAAKTLALDAGAAKAAQQLAAAGVNVLSGVAPTLYGPAFALQDPSIMALWRAGLAPEWLIEDIDRSIEDRARYLTPDVASLRSVSPTAKVAINHRRVRDAYVSSMERRTMIDMARDAFYRNARGPQQP